MEKETNKQVCNQDCFNCVHEDCINDSPCLAGEREQSELTDKAAREQPSEWHLQGHIPDKRIRSKFS